MWQVSFSQSEELSAALPILWRRACQLSGNGTSPERLPIRGNVYPTAWRMRCPPIGGHARAATAVWPGRLRSTSAEPVVIAGSENAGVHPALARAVNANEAVRRLNFYRGDVGRAEHTCCIHKFGANSDMSVAMI